MGLSLGPTLGTKSSVIFLISFFFFTKRNSVTDILGIDCEWNGYSVSENGSSRNKNQVISLAIINAFGYVLFHELMDPERLEGRKFVWGGKKASHGLEKKQIKKSESPNNYFQIVANLVKGRILICHTKNSDKNVILLT